MRIRFDVGDVSVPGELTTEGESWLWEVLAGRLRNDEGGMSDHLGKARLIAGDGPAPRDQSRLTGRRTTWAELDTGYPTLTGGRATFRAAIDADFVIREVGLTSVQSVMVARSSTRMELPPGRYTATAVLEFAPHLAPPRRERLLALL